MLITHKVIPILWMLLTLGAVAVCWWRARRQGYSGVLYALMALLLGPGGVPLTYRATRELEGHSTQSRARQQLYLAPIALIGGLSTTLFLLCHTVFPVYWNLFDGMSLALPLPTDLFRGLARWSQTLPVVLLWAAASLVLPTAFYRILGRSLPLEAADEETVLRTWLQLLPMFALTLFFFSSLALSLFGPLSQLVGWIGG